jgi:hypothetical protein
MQIPQNLSCLGIQCREQRSGAVATVIMAAPLRLLGTHRQHRLAAIQSLDLRLFIHTLLREAVAFLVDVLADGPRKATEINEEAKQCGITPITLKRAKVKLKIDSTKVGLSGPSYWSLPEGDQCPITPKS